MILVLSKVNVPSPQPQVAYGTSRLTGYQTFNLIMPGVRGEAGGKGASGGGAGGRQPSGQVGISRKYLQLHYYHCTTTTLLSFILG